MTKAGKNMELTEFLHRARRKASLEITQTGFKKRCISNALDGPKANIVCGGKSGCEASTENNFSGSAHNEIW